jgi:hypothetical protein
MQNFLPDKLMTYGSLLCFCAYLAEKSGFLGEHSLGDWIAAEQQERQVISPSELASVDEDIDGFAREALKQARRKEEAERCRSNASPVVPPQKMTIVPKIAKSW